MQLSAFTIYLPTSCPSFAHEEDSILPFRFAPKPLLLHLRDVKRVLLTSHPLQTSHSRTSTLTSCAAENTLVIIMSKCIAHLLFKLLSHRESGRAPVDPAEFKAYRAHVHEDLRRMFAPVVSHIQDRNGEVICDRLCASYISTTACS